MTLRHLLLALLVVFIWGINFVFSRIALDGMPPFMLCAVRFGLAALPGVFFFPKPNASWRLIFGFSIFTFVIQFGLSFTGMHVGLSPGLASLVMQVQVLFSIVLAMLLFRDRPSRWKMAGAPISFIGIGLVALKLSGGTSFTGLLLTLLAALAWAIGNMFSKRVDAKSSLALVTWGSLIAFPIMSGISLLVEGPELIQTSFERLSFSTVGATLYIVYFSTYVGYGAWGFLLNRYPTAVVVPFTLLIPVVGFLGSAIFLGEELTSWKLVASFFVMLGLAFNLLEKQIRSFFRRWTRK